MDTIFVQLIDDPDDEPAESFQLNIGSFSIPRYGVNLLNDPIVNITIQDNDLPPVVGENKYVRIRKWLDSFFFQR
jgi:hypothetical protein